MRLAVLGSMVWDRIDHPHVEPVERWGGIAYSLAAAAAAAPDGWTVRPVVKLGADLADQARAFLAGVPGLEEGPGVTTVPEPNNRVHLRYSDPHNRHEQLSGGVPGWSWGELAPRLEGVDAFYINLISGFELDLQAARAVRDRFPGPTYADLHSLLLGVAGDGGRVPRPLVHGDAWLDAFDTIQTNEDELVLVAGERDPERVAAAAVTRSGAVVLVTLGPDGARWFAPADGPRPWGEATGRVSRGHVPVEEPWSAGDPTGCGDVWGATCFVRLLLGDTLQAAIATANRQAARNVSHRGADGLYEHLRSHS